MLQREFEERQYKKGQIKASPSKKRKLNNRNRQQNDRTDSGPFGFGDDMDQNDPQYQRFLTHINNDDDESDMDDKQNENDLLTQTITTTNDNV